MEANSPRLNPQNEYVETPMRFLIVAGAIAAGAGESSVAVAALAPGGGQQAVIQKMAAIHDDRPLPQNRHPWRAIS